MWVVQEENLSKTWNYFNVNNVGLVSSKMNYQNGCAVSLKKKQTRQYLLNEAAWIGKGYDFQIWKLTWCHSSLYMHFLALWDYSNNHQNLEKTLMNPEDVMHFSLVKYSRGTCTRHYWFLLLIASFRQTPKSLIQINHKSILQNIKVKW